MVAPIRELGNLTQSSAIMSYNSSTLVPSQDINIAVNSVSTIFDLNNNYDEVRGRSLDISIHKPKSPSLPLSKCDEEYYVYIQQESDKMIENELANSTGSFELKYVTQKSQNNQVSKVADTPFNTRQQYALTVGPTLNQSSSKNVVNIYLNYDPDQALDLNICMIFTI